MAEPVSNAGRLRESGIDWKAFGKTHKWKVPLLGSEFRVFASENLILPGFPWILPEHGGASLRRQQDLAPDTPHLFKVIRGNLSLF